VILVFAFFAVIWYVLVPAGLIVGTVVAVMLGALATAASLILGGPGVFLGVRLTGSPRPFGRLAGWGLLAACSLGATVAAAFALAMAMLAAENLTEVFSGRAPRTPVTPA